MKKGWRLAIKLPLILLGSVLAVVVLAVPVINLLLMTPVKDKLLEKYVPDPLAVSVEKARLSVWHTFPDARLKLYGTRISYNDPQVYVDITADVDTAVARIDYIKLLGGNVTARVDTLVARAEGLALRASAGVEDLTGEDPLYSADASANANLARLVSYFKHYMPGISAKGRVDASMHAVAYKSQLNLDNIVKADVRAALKGGELSVTDKADSINAYLLRPDITLSMMPNIVKTEPNTLGAYCELDSLSFDLGENIKADGSAMRFLAQVGTQKVDSLRLPPVFGWLVAGSACFDGSDTLAVRLKGADIDYSVLNQTGTSLPVVKIGAGFDKVFLRSAAAKVGLDTFKVNAKASMKDNASRGRRFRRGPRRLSDSTAVAAGDSAAVPDSLRRLRREVPEFLSDKTFRAADIDIRLDKSLADMIAKWEPEGKLSVGRGFVATPMFPLRTRLGRVKGRFEADELNIDSLSLTAGGSDISAKGSLKGLLQSLSYGGVLDAQLYLKSAKLDVTELLAAVKKGQGVDAVDVESLDEAEADDFVETVDEQALEDSSMLIIVPANVRAALKVDVQDVIYKMLDVSDVHVNARMQERCLQITDTKASTGFGSMALDAFYSTKTRQNISAGFNLNLKDVTAEYVIGLIPQMDTLMPLLKSFKGNINVELGGTSQLDTCMNLVLPSIDAMFKINGSDLIVEEIGDLRKLTRLLMFKNKKSLIIDDMSVYGLMSDSQIELFPFLLSVDRYSVAISGWQRLDQSYKYKLSLVKSPLPFPVGIRLKGKDFEHLKISLMKPQYHSTKIPVFTEQVDNMQINLLSSIRNIFSRGVESAMRENVRAREKVEASKEAASYDKEPEEDLSEEDSAALESLATESEEAENSEIGENGGETPSGEDPAQPGTPSSPETPSEPEAPDQ